MQVAPGTERVKDNYLNNCLAVADFQCGLYSLGHVGASRRRHGNASNKNRTRDSALRCQSIPLHLTLLRYPTGARPSVLLLLLNLLLLDCYDYIIIIIVIIIIIIVVVINTLFLFR